MALCPIALTLPVAVDKCHPGTGQALVGACVSVSGRLHLHPPFPPPRLTFRGLYQLGRVSPTPYDALASVGPCHTSQKPSDPVTPQERAAG